MDDKIAPPSYPGYTNMPQPTPGVSPYQAPYGQQQYGQQQYGQQQYGQAPYPGQPTNVIIQPTPTVVVASMYKQI